MFRGGWLGKILWVDLSKGSWRTVELPSEVYRDLVGGRGFAAWLLWHHVPPGADPLGPDNLFIAAVGPLTGLPLPSSGKMVVAAKSPLTRGYGDGNIGTKMAVQLKKAGYDALVLQGKAPRPTVVVVEDGDVRLEDGEWLWGLDSYETEDRLRRDWGAGAGIVSVGPAGERLVKYAVVVSEKGRAGGRPGMGAVMASKNVKAIVVRGSGEIPVADRETLVKLGAEGYRSIRGRKGYGFWMRQGTMAALEWCQENSSLPTFNFREGVFEGWEKVSGYAMERQKVGQKGCPNCNMPCGNIAEASSGVRAELDYENVAMFTSNLGVDSLDFAIEMNLAADRDGVDTISVASAMAFAVEAYKRGVVSEKDTGGLRLDWGAVDELRELYGMILRREKGLGWLLGEGTRAASEKLGHGSEKYAMQVKGLEISAYDCHAAIGMALAYGTSPIGAHHKDAWFISWEIRMGRHLVSREKVERLIEMQRIRGGMFETFTTCRLPWIELGFELDWYVKYFEAATGVRAGMEYFYEVADRVYNLIRGYWVREYLVEGRGWSRRVDYPPARWFEEPLTRGPLKGAHLRYEDYDRMLSWYYEIRGWDSEGVPRESVLRKQGLGFVADTLARLRGG